MYEDLQKQQQQGQEVDPAKLQAAAMQLTMKQTTAQRTADVTDALSRQLDLEQAKIDREPATARFNKSRTNSNYKRPSSAHFTAAGRSGCLGSCRIREREGVSRTRIRL